LSVSNEALSASFNIVSKRNFSTNFKNVSYLVSLASVIIASSRRVLVSLFNASNKNDLANGLLASKGVSLPNNVSANSKYGSPNKTNVNSSLDLASSLCVSKSKYSASWFFVKEVVV